MTRFIKWLDNLFFGARRRRDELNLRFVETLEGLTDKMFSVARTQDLILMETKCILAKATECMSAAQQALVRALGAFERSDVTFEKIGTLADKMAAREAALEELLIAEGKMKVTQAKKLEIEVDELKKDRDAREYDNIF